MSKGLCYHKIVVFCSFNLGGGGRAGNMKGGTKIINTNANTNKNTGSKVTINARAPEAPSDGSEHGRTYTYIHIIL